MLKYILAILGTVVLSLLATTFVYKSKYESQLIQVTSLNAEVVLWQERTQEAVDREVEANTRCVISQKVVETTNAGNAVLDESRDLTLRELASQPHQALLETIIDANQKPITVADDARLSVTAMRLLNDAYCTGAKDDSACPAIGIVPSVQAKKSGR